VLGLDVVSFPQAMISRPIVAAFMPLHRYVLGNWHADARVSRAVVVGVAASVAGAAVWKAVHAAPGARWLMVAGLAVGLALLAFR
jgi:hypothetical protein